MTDDDRLPKWLCLLILIGVSGLGWALVLMPLYVMGVL